MPDILEQSGYAPDKDLKIVGTNPVKHDGPDKVTGRAMFGADLMVPGMLVGKILRSPHAHAILKSIDTSKAEALAGVKAVVTRDDFPEIPQGTVPGDMTRNCMAREKVLYEGHALAAVAAIRESIAKQALKLIEVEYEILPHVIDPIAAMQSDAPILHDYIRTKNDPQAPDQPTNVVQRLDIGRGDVDKGFAGADEIVEREFSTEPMHQSYIEPQACVAECRDDGQIDLWCCTQGTHVFRDRLAILLEMDSSKIKVTQSELGGGFGGKTTLYAEPAAIMLSRKARCPVKITLTRNEVFRATGPVSATRSRVKIGVTKDGRITAAEAEMIFQAGAFTGSMFDNAPKAMFTRYNLENVKTVSYEVVSNRAKVNAFRAPCVPQVTFAVESLIDELAKKLDMDPLELRLRNAASEGYTTLYGETLGPIGYVETLEAAKKCDHYLSPLPAGQGRGISTGFWFNRGGDTTGSLTITPDGSVTIMLGTSDVAGSRISISMMAAEELGIPVEKVRANLADTSTLGNNRVTAGSRTTFSSGMVIIDSARQCIAELVRRAAEIWDVPEEGVVFDAGYCRPSSSNVGEFEPLSIAEIAAKTSVSHGAIAGHSEMHVTGAGPGFGVHLVDVEVDHETGRVDVKRYTVIEDAGKAIHPLQVEGQYQGGAAQGAGWALNEAYIYDDNGKLENAGFLDYRIPVASDLPMIDTVIVEVPNPKHPYGLRGVGEVPVTPSLGALANAVSDAIGIRQVSLPMSPPNLLAQL
ncbi:MAG: xanthine dehydrogenase family protein molybdopterin-binding subunit [Rhodospirillales bacterium]|jgi:CO/xanthine dehydrogenase Mo-binding subunit|nr:oxidoreductase [Rhodospirillaceae bacterium]MDP6426617.1 xanthine dehydrogenase family protein molybdopterin-binding subunit [Rhodospirillales bacterium]MDP6644663.1 xanthine dehydrogenase family protein molybdopterin-binding subunit [Rhodospirillales bacterium]MDP6842238.1 xanthine dehydrogenase family protein molybdopterin-binding subunit [Rhodospirillales bacterium]